MLTSHTGHCELHTQYETASAPCAAANSRARSGCLPARAVPRAEDANGSIPPGSEWQVQTVLLPDSAHELCIPSAIWKVSQTKLRLRRVNSRLELRAAYLPGPLPIPHLCCIQPPTR